MPKGPHGEKRPADVIGNAVKVMRIATGEIVEMVEAKAKSAAAELGSKGGPTRDARADEIQPRRFAREHFRKRAAIALADHHHDLALARPVLE